MRQDVDIDLLLFYQEVKHFLNGYAVEDISISKKSRHGR